ncbi:hypothetical protein U1Q18_047678 [Sarracenia purpurea var. burkii]
MHRYKERVYVSTKRSFTTVCTSLTGIRCIYLSYCVSLLADTGARLLARLYSAYLLRALGFHHTYVHKNAVSATFSAALLPPQSSLQTIGLDLVDDNVYEIKWNGFVSVEEVWCERVKKLQSKQRYYS